MVTEAMEIDNARFRWSRSFPGLGIDLRAITVREPRLLGRERYVVRCVITHGNARFIRR